MLKLSMTAIASALILLSAIPAKAGSFEELLQKSLTPQETQVYKQMGNAHANQLARDACKAFDAGASVTDFATQVALSMIADGGSQEELEALASNSGKVIVVGVRSFCPQHWQKLQTSQAPNL